MGLFDYFKKKKAQDEIFGKLFDGIFPGGKSEIAKHVSQLSEILDHNYSLSQLEPQYVRAVTYFHITSDKSKQNIKRYVLKHDDNIFSERDLEKLYDFLQKKFLINKTHGADDDFINALSKGMFGGNKGYDLDEIPGGYGEFGLVVTNPIPVQGVMSNEVYLKNIVTSDGRKIHWEREGSTEIDNIENAIDCYKIFDANDNYITNIFISPYHKRISQKIPKGFKLKN